MEQWLIDNQLWCQFSIFILAFGLLAAWEKKRPWRPWLINRKTRWLRHFSLALFSQLCVRLIFPVFLVVMAIKVQSKGLGILNHSHVPYPLRVLLGILALDFALYMQHRLMHKYQWLWRIHRVHHMDKQVDISTGLRFHPIEAMITMGVKMLAIAFFGVSALGVLLFEIWLNASLLFVHINVPFRFKTDKALRRLIVTPGMHRIHHSDHPPETNSNYGFCLSWWDRMLDSYTFISQTGERKLVLGLEGYRDAKYQTFENMLLTPFNVKSLRVKPPKKLKIKFKMHEKLPPQ